MLVIMSYMMIFYIGLKGVESYQIGSASDKEEPKMIGRFILTICAMAVIMFTAMVLNTTGP